MATVLFPPDWASPGAIGSTTPNTLMGTTLSVTDGTLSAPSVNFANATTVGLYYDSANTRLGFTSGNQRSFTFSRGNSPLSYVLALGNSPIAGFYAVNDANAVAIGTAGLSATSHTGQGAIGFGGAAVGGSMDVLLGREAAFTLALCNSTNPNIFRIYNTFTSSTNHERGKLEWASNEFRIGTEKGTGGGSARGLALQTDGVTRLAISATGSLIFTSPAAPANASATGTAGEIRIDADYIYVCVANSQWKRAALSTW